MSESGMTASLAALPDTTLLLRLASPETRREAARTLARELGGDDLLLFLRDAEVGVLLPAPGMVQTLPGGQHWRALLAACLQHGEASALMRVGDGASEIAAWGIACGADVVAVLIGGEPERQRVRALVPLLLLTSLAVRGEHAVGIAQASAHLARESAVRAEALATSLDRALHQTEAARAQADRANRAKSDFLAMMSHELRTPLNAIGGYAELMSMGIRGPVTEAQREDLQRIQRSQLYLLGLINEVLNYAKLETGSVRYEVEDVGVTGAVAAVESLLLPQIRTRALALDTAGCDLGLVVRADREKLQQILVNLLSNAVKFTDRGGLIAIVCQAHADATRSETISIAVHDSGIGIPADKLEAVFEPFVQIGRALNTPSEGTGLGLAISRDLARGMGGELVAESTEGVGSTFTLTLPRSP